MLSAYPAGPALVRLPVQWDLLDSPPWKIRETQQNLPLRKIEAPGSYKGSRALEQPSPRTAHVANLWVKRLNSKES